MRIKGVPLARVPGLLQLPRMDFSRPASVFIAVCDHFEPKWLNPARYVQDARVDRWVREYPRTVDGIADSAGRPPQHTFFYPADEYDAEHVEQIAGLCRQGCGDMEVHLHHRNDTAPAFRETLEDYVNVLSSRHGLLDRDPDGRITYGFIHGNWALDNSRPDGDWCGVNDEITVLLETGCYADFTMPSAPDPCQTTTINSIYYAIDDPQRPKSHDTGIHARVGQWPPEDGLLMIQGPLAFDWSHRKWGLLPRLENGDLTRARPPSLARFHLWCAAGVAVAGRPDWRFVKLHTHGAQESNAEMLLGAAMRRFHEDLCKLSTTHPAFKYYYVTAREMSALVHEAERALAISRLESPSASGHAEHPFPCRGGGSQILDIVHILRAATRPV
jgi:hypothetical protein